MYTNTYPNNIIRVYRRPEVSHAVSNVQWHITDMQRMGVAIWNRDSTGDHVGISDCLNLVDVILVNAVIKQTGGKYIKNIFTLKLKVENM